jgi:hypothetical protein
MVVSSFWDVRSKTDLGEFAVEPSAQKPNKLITNNLGASFPSTLPKAI